MKDDKFTANMRRYAKSIADYRDVIRMDGAVQALVLRMRRVGPAREKDHDEIAGAIIAISMALDKLRTDLPDFVICLCC